MVVMVHGRTVSADVGNDQGMPPPQHGSNGAWSHWCMVALCLLMSEMIRTCHLPSMVVMVHGCMVSPDVGNDQDMPPPQRGSNSAWSHSVS